MALPSSPGPRRRHSVGDYVLFLRATVYLAAAAALLVLVPFDRLSAFLVSNRRSARRDRDIEYPDRVRWAVRAAARRVPWRSDCFRQAVAAHLLLSRSGHEPIIHIGVARQADGSLGGHAWVTCGEQLIVGDGDLETFTVLHRLPAAQADER
jgi:hypothetical protein